MVNCDNKDLPFQSLFAGALQEAGEGTALRMVEVDTTDAVKYYDCDKIDVGLDIESVLRPLFGLNGNNEPALRIGLSADCTPDTDAITCDQKDKTTLDLLRDVVYVTPTGEQFLLVCLETL
jgi:hypothetical protein